MNTFQIKIFAMIFMVVDHVGAVLFPQIFFLRLIGRLSFPLFAWLAANGSVHTTNIKRYLVRLFGFAVISQVPFYFFHRLIDPTTWATNIFFTLGIGVGVIAVLKTNRRATVQILAICGGALLAQLLHTDYGAFGVLFIIVCYLYYRSMPKMAVTLVALICCSYIIPSVLQIVQTHAVENPLKLFEPIGLASFAFVAYYNGQQGKKMKYSFYMFYPLHLILLIVVAGLMK
jgi:hypothetical protein